MARRTASTDAEATRAEELKDGGGLTLELVGLGVEQFETVCRAVRGVDLEYAVDSEGRLAIASPSAAQIDDLRTSARHARRDLDDAVRERLRARRGSKWLAVDDLTMSERDDVVSTLAQRGVLAAVDDADIAVERRGVTQAERIIDEVLEGQLGGDGDDEDRDDGEGRAPSRRPGDRTSGTGPPAANFDAALAPHSKRLMGFMVDATAFVSLAFGLGFATQALGIGAAAGLLMGAVAWFVTTTLLHARTGRTLGKHLMDTRVVDASSGEPITLARSTVRSLVQFMPIVLGAGGILVAVAIHAAVLLLPDRQGLHDRLARTVVVHEGD